MPWTRAAKHVPDALAREAPRWRRPGTRGYASPVTTPYASLSESDWAELERIHDLMEDGDREGARAAVDALRAGRADQADLRLLDAQVRLDEGDAEAALALLSGAERCADPAEFFATRASCHHESVHFEAARDDARQ